MESLKQDSTLWIAMNATLSCDDKIFTKQSNGAIFAFK